jgi:hypothetical protein
VVEVPLARFAREARSYTDGTDAATLAGVAQSICAQGGDQFGVLSHRCPWVAAGELIEALAREGHDDMASDALWAAATSSIRAAAPTAAAVELPRGAALRAWSTDEGGASAVDIVVAPDERGGLRRCLAGEFSMYRYILRESCSQFDSLPLTYFLAALLPTIDALRAEHHARLHVYVVLAGDGEGGEGPKGGVTPRAWLFRLVARRFDVTLVHGGASTAAMGAHRWSDALWRSAHRIGVGATVALLSESAVVTGRWLHSLTRCVHVARGAAQREGNASAAGARLCVPSAAGDAVERSGVAPDAATRTHFARQSVARALWRRASHRAARTDARAARAALCAVLRRNDLVQAHDAFEMALVSTPGATVDDNFNRFFDVYATDAALVFDGAHCVDAQCTRTALRSALRSGAAEIPSTPSPAQERALHSTPNRSVVFVLHDAVPGAGSPGGGLMATVQSAAALAERGVVVRIAALFDALPILAAQFPAVEARGLLVGFDSERVDAELLPLLGSFDVAVATFFPTLWIVRRAMRRYPALSGVYYVQDYEPLFPLPAAFRSAAKFSYALSASAPRLTVVSYSDWIRRELRTKHGVESMKVGAAVDDARFNVSLERGADEGDGSTSTLAVCAMVRPSTPRRAPAETVAALSALAARLGDAVEIHTFGCTAAALDAQCAEQASASAGSGKWRGAASALGAGHLHWGELDRDGVAQMLNDCDVFLDLSRWQAFGFTGLEAMASGAVPIVTQRGGANEYARHRENALVVDVSDGDAIVERVAALAADRPRLARMRLAALATASTFTLDRVAASWLAVLDEVTHDVAI